jgi:hypothetical protein
MKDILNPVKIVVLMKYKEAGQLPGLFVLLFKYGVINPKVGSFINLPHIPLLRAAMF